MYDNADPQSFFSLTGVTREVFGVLLDIIYPAHDTSQWIVRRKRGRPRLLWPTAELGLFLFWIGSTMNLKHLCLIFGITPSVCSRSIIKLLKRIPSKLRNHPFARVEFPNLNRMRELAAIVEAREPIADDVIGFMDGLSLHSESSSEPIAQNALYNGYHVDTMVNNVFAYGSDGKVFLAAINYPGSHHDGSIVSHILPYIKDKIGSYKICVDQGFPRSGQAQDILVGPISRRRAAKLSPILRPYILQLSNCYVSLRQGSEWGMRGLQGSFPRFKRRLPGNALKQKRMFESIILIHNFRTHLLGCNQISAVFDSEYERVITLHGHDRIARYYNYDYEVE